MEILFDETYTSSSDQRSSRNIWYGYADISVKDEYGLSIKLDDELMNILCGLIKNDLSKNAANPPTETNWYFYGSAVAQDAIGDSIRPTIMVRERSGEFVSNFSISDYDFAMNIDAVLSFKADFEGRLAGLSKGMGM